jgi:cytochrome c5
MSAHHDNSSHEKKKSTLEILVWVLFAIVLPFFIIVSVLSMALPAKNTVPYPASHPEATAQRIQKVGAIELQAANRELKSGEEVYNAQCGACHTAGAAGAPKFKDAGAWGARITKGYDALLTSALKGKGAMGAQGGGAFDDVEIGRAVVHMANAAGAKFAEPKKPEAK